MVRDLQLRLCAASLTKYRRDRRKLTFYFVADKRIDFRELVRELFRSVTVPHRRVSSLSPPTDFTKPEYGWLPFKA